MKFTKAFLIKLVGTVATAVAAGTVPFIPLPYQPIAVGVATLLLGWLHLPRPGDTKVIPDQKAAP